MRFRDKFMYFMMFVGSVDAIAYGAYGVGARIVAGATGVAILIAMGLHWAVHADKEHTLSNMNPDQIQRLRPDLQVAAKGADAQPATLIAQHPTPALPAITKKEENDN